MEGRLFVSYTAAMSTLHPLPVPLNHSALLRQVHITIVRSKQMNSVDDLAILGRSHAK